MKRILLFTLLLCIYYPSKAQLVKNPKAFLGAGVFLSSHKNNPYGLRTNQYGIVPLESQAFQLRGGYRTEYDSTLYSESKKLQRKFDFAYANEITANIGIQNQSFIIPEAYLKARFKAIEAYFGRRREIVGLVDSTLSSGSYIWSGNSLPIPKIQIAIPNYVSIIGKGLVSIKGAYAHGWFGSSDSTKNYFLHQKYLYGRIGRESWKLRFYAGFNHQAQWGGRPNNPYTEKETGKLITNYGNDFNTYMNVVTGVSLNTKGGNTIPGIPLNDAFNRSGNHLGTIDLAMEVVLKNSNLMIYRQSIYEDGSLFYLNNIADGLLGISLKRKNVKEGLIGINFEYLNTTSQGGNVFLDAPPQLRGDDNYFNNGLYTWTYFNNTIGSPLLTPLKTLNMNIFTKDYDYVQKNVHRDLIINNRVKAYSLRMNYILKSIHFDTGLINSRNQVTFTSSTFKQLSIIQNMTFKLKANFINLSIAYDTEGIYKGCLGGSFGITRRFF